MGLDIRLPIGLLFVVLGAVLALYGLVADPAVYARSLGYNLNLWWGVVLLCGGGAMLLLSRRARRRAIAGSGEGDTLAPGAHTTAAAGQTQRQDGSPDHPDDTTPRA